MSADVVPEQFEFVLVDGLDFVERQDFVTRASAVIARATGAVEVDCSGLQNIDDPTIGMLVLLARNAQRRGLTVTLSAPTEVLLRRLGEAGVIDRFVTRA